ncbi:MAG: GAF domain-containing protein [Bacteroidales bacterium]|nr:GAF domain-containing protein [Bacteroidales bacterium]
MTQFLHNRLTIFILFILLLADFLLLYSLFQRMENHPSQTLTVAFVTGILLAGVFSFLLFLSAVQKNISEDETINPEAETNSAAINVNESLSSSENTREISDSTVSVHADAENLLPAAIPEKLELFAEGVLSHLAQKFEIVTGLFYSSVPDSDVFRPVARYALYSPDPPPEIRLGESLPGQAVKDRRILYVTHVPKNYLTVISGLGSSDPGFLLILPITEEDKKLGFIEIATFKPFSENDFQVLTQLGKLVAKILISNFNTNNRA